MFRRFTEIILKQQFICLSCIIETNPTPYNPYVYISKNMTYVINAASIFPKWSLSHLEMPHFSTIKKVIYSSVVLIWINVRFLDRKGSSIHFFWPNHDNTCLTSIHVIIWKVAPLPYVSTSWLCSFNNDNTQRVQRFSWLNTHFMLFFALF